MMKEETEFSTGEECLYHEEGLDLRCRILDIYQLNGWLHLNLEALEVVEEIPFLAHEVKVGSSFSASKRLDDNSEPWSIKEVQPRWRH